MTDADPNTPIAVGDVTLYPPEPDDHGGDVFGFYWHTPNGGIEADGGISRSAGGVVISEVRVSTQMSSGVTHQMLRSVPLGEILAVARAELTSADDAVQAHPIVVPPGKHTAMTDELLRNVARAYLEESSGKGRGVVKRLQERFDRPEGTIITWISRARKEGWLGPAVSGRVGAEPGPKLMAWMRQVIGDSENTTREARRIAEAWGGATPGVVAQALRAYSDIAERDISHHMGLPPLETAVAAQVLYGRPLSAELAERQERAGDSYEDALSALLVELHGEFNKRAESESGSSVSPSGNK